MGSDPDDPLGLKRHGLQTQEGVDVRHPFKQRPLVVIQFNIFHIPPPLPSITEKTES